MFPVSQDYKVLADAVLRSVDPHPFDLHPNQFLRDMGTATEDIVVL